MSLFITFEGGEGSGKSYQSRALYRRLRRRGIPVIRLHEPGGTAVGVRISRLLKWARQTEISALSELMLFNAARAQLVHQVITPALAAGQVVICDRYADSTLAYQQYGRGLDAALVQRVNQSATAGLNPDLTLLLDAPPETGMRRTDGRRRDRFEAEALAFHQMVRAGYLELAARNPERWRVIDGGGTKRAVAETVWQHVNARLGAGDGI